MRLMRFPSVHGDQVVFTYASDLWVSNLNGGIARRLTTSPGLEQKAYFSPDGSMIAFSGQYDGNTDVFVMPAEGGEPKRLTYEPEGSICQGWTPDGKIAYISGYGSFTNRQRRLWLVDPRGGLPQATPILEASDIWFSPDGHQVAYDRQPSNRFNWRRYRGGSQGVISIYDLANNTYKELPHGNENSWNPMWVGHSIYFVSDKNEQTVNLYRYDLDSGKTEQLTHYQNTDIHWPATDGKTIVFEKDGYLFEYDIATGRANKISPEVLGDLNFTRPEMRSLAGSISAGDISPSGVRVVVEARGHIFSIPAHHGETRDMTGDSPKDSRSRFPNWSPDGKSIAYISDKSGEYQIYTEPQLGGVATQVSSYSGPSIENIGWSPDSKWILFGTADGNMQLLDPATMKQTLVYTGEYGPVSSVDFSPDSKWIAYVAPLKNQFGALFLYNVASGKSTQVTEGYYNDSSVSFDLSGKYLYLTSDRTYNVQPSPFEDNLVLGPTTRVYVLPLAKTTKDPLLSEDDEEAAGGEAAKPKAEGGAPKPGGAPAAPSTDVQIDLDGLGNRAIALPMPAANYTGVIGVDNGVLYSSPGSLVKFDLASKQSSPVFVGPAQVLGFNPKRTMFVYWGGGTLGIGSIHPGPPEQIGAGKVDTAGVEAVIDPRAEWKQIFWEAWRYERDHYYDKDFLGLNWDAIGKHYATYLPYVAHRDDLNYILGLMIGEFGTSHSYVLGGDYGGPILHINTGQLGADYEAVGSKVRFKKIYRGEQFEENSRRGPLGDPGINVKEGDYLLAIDGQPVDEMHPPDSRLVDRAGKEVELTVNSEPTLTGARKVLVTPIASEDQLRTIDWIEANRHYVAEKSGGKLGYMYVPDTSDPGMTEFLKGYYSQSDKDGLIVDERWNAGGHIPTFYTEKLGRTYRAYLKPRWGAMVGFPVQSVDAPKDMLINGYSGSGGDMFPWLFRQAKLGPLIGERTWGGLVGINGSASLIDGGFLTAPAFALFDQTTGQWIAENHGIDPDITVDLRPDLLAKGEDPQLDAAINYLMDYLKNHPAPKFKVPDYKRVKPASGGSR